VIRGTHFSTTNDQTVDGWGGNPEVESSVPKSCSMAEHWRFVGALGGVEFESSSPRNILFAVHPGISYVALVCAEPCVSTRRPRPGAT
jgi:hypothetical protein